MASLDPLWRGAVEKRLAGLATDELRVVEGGETRTYGAAPNPDSLSATLHVHDSRLWSGIVRRGVRARGTHLSAEERTTAARLVTRS